MTQRVRASTLCDIEIFVPFYGVRAKLGKNRYLCLIKFWRMKTRRFRQLETELETLKGDCHYFPYLSQYVSL